MPKLTASGTATTIPEVVAIPVVDQTLVEPTPVVLDLDLVGLTNLALVDLANLTLVARRFISLFLDLQERMVQ